MSAKQTIKKICLKLGIYEQVARVYSKVNGRANKKRVEEILSKENEFSFDKTTTLNGKIGRLRIALHQIEKTLVKGKTNYKFLEERCINFLKQVEDLLKEYPEYNIESDIVLDTIGMCYLLIDEARIGGYEAKDLKEKIDSFIKDHNVNRDKIHKIAIESKKRDEIEQIDFDSYSAFVRNRHSIRETDKEVITYEEMMKVVELAEICPSACNRQPMKVYYLEDPESYRSLFPDPQISKDIYNLLVVTVNKAYYSTNETLQPWIDSGIFLESLIMAMHANRLASCLFQCIKGTNRYHEVKKALNIPKEEDIACFIGYGRLKEDVRYITTHRKEVEEILVKSNPVSRIRGGYSLSYIIPNHLEYAA